MRTLTACALIYLMAGCAVFDSNNPNENTPGQPSVERGPTLCVDGTPPPCTPRS